MEKKKSGSERLALLDSLRGLTLISMILYHACWDAVYLLGANWPWYGSRAAYIWQQSICWTFIMLSGFCIPFSSKLLRRGLEVFGAGALVMAVTCLLLPEDRVVFGVLTLIGSCMLLMIPLRKILGGDSRAEATADRTAVRKASGVSRAETDDSNSGSAVCQSCDCVFGISAGRLLFDGLFFFTSLELFISLRI